jgi:chromosome segregation ATPase
MDEEPDTDSLTELARGTSIKVAELLGKHDPSAIDVFDDFSDTAMAALDADQLSLTQMRMSLDDFLGQATIKSAKLHTASETLMGSRSKLDRLNRSARTLHDEIDSVLCQNRILSHKLVRYSLIEAELDSLKREFDLLQMTLPRYQSQIASEKEKQAQIMVEMAAYGPSSGFTELDLMRRRCKKNQMKILELGAMIRRHSLMQPHSSSTRRPSDASRGPSLIIHRITEAADDVRFLTGLLERSLRDNTAVKAELTRIDADMAVVEQETATLKEAVRNLLPETSE